MDNTYFPSFKDFSVNESNVDDAHITIKFDKADNALNILTPNKSNIQIYDDSISVETDNGNITNYYFNDKQKKEILQYLSKLWK